MKNIKLTYQSYGSSILLFIEGATHADAYGKYLSFYNWNGTSSEPDYVTKNIIAVWSTIERLQVYLFNQRLMQLWGDKFKGVKGGAKNEAIRLAEKDLEEINYETYRTVNNNSTVEYELGTISAEKPDDDFKDFCITRGFQS